MLYKIWIFLTLDELTQKDATWLNHESQQERVNKACINTRSKYDHVYK